MLVTSSVRSPWQYAPSGWLRQYLEACRHNEYPWSYHLLSGLLTLGAIVGRRAGIQRSTYTLWPPISIILLGSSGSGKSEALGVSRRVLEYAGVALPGFVVGDDTGSTSTRGWMRKWQKLQEEKEATVLEGVEFMDEVSAILKERVGTESASQWLIKMLQHKDGKTGDHTGYLGESFILNCTISFGFASPLGTFRDALDLSAFTDGLMHRFLFAHERDLDYTRGEARLGEDTLKALAHDALIIRNGAPQWMTLTEGAQDALEVLKSKSRHERPALAALGGFWRRYPGIILKVANLFALSDFLPAIQKEHILRADSLLKHHLYPPLSTLVTQVAAGPKKRVLFRILDDLEMAGPHGMELVDFMAKLETTSHTQQMDMLRAAVGSRIVFTNGTRVFATEVWANDFGKPTDHPRDLDD